MKLIVDDIGNSGLPLYDCNEGDVVLVASPNRRKSIKQKCKQVRVMVPIYPITIDLLLGIAETIKLAKKERRKNAVMIVKGNRIGFLVHANWK